MCIINNVAGGGGEGGIVWHTLLENNESHSFRCSSTEKCRKQVGDDVEEGAVQFLGVMTCTFFLTAPHFHPVSQAFLSGNKQGQWHLQERGRFMVGPFQKLKIFSFAITWIHCTTIVPPFIVRKMTPLYSFQHCHSWKYHAKGRRNQINLEFSMAL